MRRPCGSIAHTWQRTSCLESNRSMPCTSKHFPVVCVKKVQTCSCMRAGCVNTLQFYLEWSAMVGAHVIFMHEITNPPTIIWQCIPLTNDAATWHAHTLSCSGTSMVMGDTETCLSQYGSSAKVAPCMAQCIVLCCAVQRLRMYRLQQLCILLHRRHLAEH